jgi:ECF sigma factor
MSDLTRILLQIEQGDPTAAEQLLPLVYDELRKLAAAKLALEKPGQPLQDCEARCKRAAKADLQHADRLAQFATKSG